MRPCTAFDFLNMSSGENRVFGSPALDRLHFVPVIGRAIRSLEKDFPEEVKKYAPAYEAADDPVLQKQMILYDPMAFIGPAEKGTRASFFRIRVGADDADTSFSIAVTLALRLANAGLPSDYALVWGQPHCEADYPGELLSWIDSICPRE